MVNKTNIHRKNTLKACLLLIALGFIWGSGYSLAKFAMTNDVPPLGYAFWQALGPALLLSIGAFLYQPRSFTVLLTHWRFFLVCGLSGIAIPNTNMYFISSHLPAGLLAVLVNTVPLMVYPLALISRQEQFDWWRCLALLLGCYGILMLVTPIDGYFVSAWTLLALISPLAFAFCAVYISARQPPTLDALSAAGGMLLTATLLLTPLVIQQQAFYPLTPPYSVAKGVVILEMLLSSLGYFIFFRLIRLAGPVFYSLTGGVVAITGLFWGFIVFNENLLQAQYLSISCIVSAIFLLSWRQAKQPTGERIHGK